MIPKIVVSNHSTLVTDDYVASIIPAFQIQVTRDFAPIWLREAHVEFAPGKTINQLPKASPRLWNMVLQDTLDVKDALGYHEVLKLFPYGLVSIKPEVDAKMPWEDTLSHEILEMLANPHLLNKVIVGMEVYDREVCDAVEDAQFDYYINQVPMSNFVTPAWFRPKGTPPFDFLGKCTRPLQILEGGYIPSEKLGQKADRLLRILLHDGQEMKTNLIPIGSRRWRFLNL